MDKSPPDPQTAQPNAASDNFRMTCLGCGCLCDDLVVNKETLNDFFSAWKQADGLDLASDFQPPDIGQPFFKNPQPTCQQWTQWLYQEGKNLWPEKETKAEFHLSCQKVHEILSNAKRPSLLGLSRSSAETVQQAVLLAEKQKAIIDPAISPNERAKTLAFCQTGKSSSSWKEVGRNCEEIFFWKCHPQQSPCFFSQLGLDPNKHKLHFLDQSICEKWDKHPELANWPKESIISLTIPGNDLQTLQTIQLLEVEKNAHLSEEEILRLTGNTETTWQAILNSPKRQCWIFDQFIGEDSGEIKDQSFLELCYETVFKFSRSHKPKKPRYVHFWPTTELSSETTTQTLSSMTGYPFSVDLSDPNHPRFDPCRWRFENLISETQVDAIVVVEPEQQILELLTDLNVTHIPIIEIGHRQRIPNANLFLQCSRLGIHRTMHDSSEFSNGNTLYRPDGTTVQITGFVDTTRPPAKKWLEGILACSIQG